MPTFIEKPTTFIAVGDKAKTIDEYVGRVTSQTEQVSIAHMKSPPGWTEPGQTPEFTVYNYVLKGTLHVKHKEGVVEVNAGQALVAHRGEWVQYSTPGPKGAEYIAVCVPAFSPKTVHRD
jgi:mannose-6-phosphate isomerase-like protein (cupin superfamily)